MKYISTRDEGPVYKEFTFLEAVLAGLAPDGGLLVPETIPSISALELEEWGSLSYQELCFRILRRFMSEEEVSDDELLTMIRAAYNGSNFEGGQIAPVVPVGDLYVMELFHGPTFAFKDVALQLLGHLFDLALRKRNARMTILGATSGDTGSAAIAGVKGRSNIDCVILYPLGRTSRVQELQMISNLDENIHCLAVKDAVFDDCQNIVKSCFTDADFNAEMSLGAVNSINWSRILAQVVYYVHAALLVCKNENKKAVSFVVPTGNFGNVLAGYYAKKMGAPIAKLIVASNTNDILPRFFDHGEYRITGPVVPTMSPSMDIAVSSNFERYIYDLLERDGKKTRDKFDQLRGVDKKFTVEKAELEIARSHFTAFCVNEHETLITIADCYLKHGYLLCPHSAVGFAAGIRYSVTSAEHEAVVTLATAHIGKFTENIVMSSSINGVDPSLVDAVEMAVPEKLRTLLSEAKTRRIEIPNSVEAVKEYLRTRVGGIRP